MRIATVAVCGLAALAAPAGASAAKTKACGAEGPQTLQGGIKESVDVVGVCLVNGGQLQVRGTLTVEPGGSLIANFGFNEVKPGGATPRLLLFGSLTVKEGGTAIIGCEPFHYTCTGDEGNTVYSRSVIHGNVTGKGAAGIIMHADHVYGNISQSGGGAPNSRCSVYSDYEDVLVKGNVTVKGLESCWLGLARDKVFGGMLLENNHLEDPDAIEVLANNVKGNLVCKSNSMVWNSAEAEFGQVALFPRTSEPNTVGGKRSGQCVHSSPESLEAYEKGELGEGAF